MAELTATDLAQVAADHAEIRNLLGRVAQLADSGDIDEYMACYTDDAVWAMPADPKIGLEASERKGAEVIRAGVVERRAAGLQGPGTSSLHVLTTMSVQLDGDTATGHAYFQFYSDTEGAMNLVNMGQYHDQFRRTADGWKLARRQISMG